MVGLLSSRALRVPAPVLLVLAAAAFLTALSPLAEAGHGTAFTGLKDGYVLNDSFNGGPAFNFVNAADGTDITPPDEGSSDFPVPFPFAFRHFNRCPASFQVNDNGIVLMSPTTADTFSYQDMPNPAAPNDLLAILWGDLDSTVDGNVYWKVTGEAPDRILYIQYSKYGLYPTQPGADLEAQAKIFERNSEVQVHINNAFLAGNPTVGGAVFVGRIGMENGDGTQGFHFKTSGNNAAGTHNVHQQAITMTPVNTPPTLRPAAASILEDGGSVTVALVGSDADCNDTPYLGTGFAPYEIGTPEVGSATGGPGPSLEYTVAPDFFGTAVVPVTLTDLAGDTAAQDVTITVLPVNDAPSFSLLPAISRPASDDAVVIDSFATDILKGPVNEASQVVSFELSGYDSAMFEVAPSISSAGTLTFDPACTAFGKSTSVTVVARDNGGTSNGGTAASTPRAFTLSLTSGPGCPPQLGLQSVSPDSGPSAGGTVVTLVGNDISTTGPVAVAFGGSPAADVEVVSDTEIHAVTPPGTVGLVDVAVTNPDGQRSVLPSAFEYMDTTPPAIVSVSPGMGSTLGGPGVVVTGTGFMAGATVTFGGVPATGVNVGGPTSITVTAPAHAAGPVSVVVTNPDGQASTPGEAFTYVAPTTTSTAPPPVGGNGCQGPDPWSGNGNVVHGECDPSSTSKPPPSAPASPTLTAGPTPSPSPTPSSAALGASAPADLEALSGATVGLKGVATGVGPTGKFEWRQTSGPAVALTGAKTASASFVAPDVPVGETEVFGFEFKVTEGGRTATDAVQVLVRGVADGAPAAVSGELGLSEEEAAFQGSSGEVSDEGEGGAGLLAIVLGSLGALVVLAGLGLLALFIVKRRPPPAAP